MSQNLSLVIHNNYEDLRKLCETASKFLESLSLPFSASYAADLALEELITNIIKYGYDDKSSHEIAVSLTNVGKNLAIRIEDDGHPFDPVAAPSPDTDLSIEDRKIGGLGIHLVKNSCESMIYKRENNRNIVEVRVSTKPAAQAQEKNGA